MGVKNVYKMPKATLITILTKGKPPAEFTVKNKLGQPCTSGKQCYSKNCVANQCASKKKNSE